MGLFGVKRYDDDVPRHYFSILSPIDLSVSENLELPSFVKDEDVNGGSCGDVVYFYGCNGKTVIFNLENNDCIVVPPHEVFARIKYRGCRVNNYDALENDDYIKSGGLVDCEYKCCGVSYDAKSREYKVIRICWEIVWNKEDEESVVSYYFDLYSVLSGSAKEITGPSRKCCPQGGTSTYVGEAGSGSGSCYWVSFLYVRDRSDPLDRHVLSFDFATERFDQFPLPLPATTAKDITIQFELVECRGSLGALVHWIPPDEFSTEDDEYSSDLSVQLFVRNGNGNGNGKGTSWDLLYDVRVAGAERPLALKDDRVLFLSGYDRKLMVYYLASKTLKKLDINCSTDLCGICFGDKKKKKKKTLMS